MLLALRRQGLPLDDLVDAVRQALPAAGRSSVGRLLRRHGVSRLGGREQQESGQDDKHRQFKDYPPDLVHIDCFYRHMARSIATKQQHFCAASLGK